jgi:hypothetical protein
VARRATVDLADCKLLFPQHLRRLTVAKTSRPEDEIEQTADQVDEIEVDDEDDEDEDDDWGTDDSDEEDGDQDNGEDEVEQDDGGR